MSDALVNLAPGLYVALLAVGLATLLHRHFDSLPRASWAVIGAAMVALFGPILFGSGVMLPIEVVIGQPPFVRVRLPEPLPRLGIQVDQILQMAPWTQVVRRELFAGRLPMWNETVGAGMPLAGDPQAQVLQPFMLLALPFTVPVAAGVSAALRLLVALVFSALVFGRRGLNRWAALGGALTYGLGGFVISWLGWPMGNVAATLPLVVYALDRAIWVGRRADFGLLIVALVVLLGGGHPEVISYVTIFGGAVALTWLIRRQRARGRFGAARPFDQGTIAHDGRWASAGAGAFPGNLTKLLAAGLLAALLVGPVLVAAADFLPQTRRATVLEGALRSGDLLPTVAAKLLDPDAWQAWAERSHGRVVALFAPFLFGRIADAWWGPGNVVENPAGYVGTAALVLAGAALVRRRRVGAADEVRADRWEGLLAITVVITVLLVAQPPGVKEALGRLPVVGMSAAHFHHRVIMVLTFALAGLAAHELDRWLRRAPLGKRGRVDRPRQRALVVAGALVALTAVAATTVRPPPGVADPRPAGIARVAAVASLTAAAAFMPPAWAAATVLGALGGELWWVHRGHLQARPGRLALPPMPSLDWLAAHQSSYRIAGVGMALMPNLAGYYGLRDARGDNPSLPNEFVMFTESLVEPPHFGLWHAAALDDPRLDVLGVRYALVARRETKRRVVWVGRGGAIVERKSALPLLFLPAAAEPLAGRSHRDAWDAVKDFSAVAVVDEDTTWSAGRPNRSRLARLSLEPTRLAAVARLSEPRLLASGVFQDGQWRLLVDGEPQPTLVTNGLFVGGWLPREAQQVVLIYASRPLLIGAALAAIGLAGALALCLGAPRRRARPTVV